MKPVIDFSKHADIARVVKNAVLDDVSPLDKGSVFQYWVGETDLDPQGVRKAVFEMAHKLYSIGRVHLAQRAMGNGVYSYLAEVK